MRKTLFSLIFFITASIFVLGWSGLALAASEVELDDSIFRYNCYGGSGDYYVDIPSSYSGTKVLVEAAGTTNPPSCAEVGVDLCGQEESCYVNVTPGQRLDFRVSWYCGACGDYDSESWTIEVSSVSGPVCGNGSCESGETCSSCSSDCGSCTKSDGSSCSYNSECSGGYCVHSICRAYPYYRGDGYCDFSEGEGCASSDCTTYSSCLAAEGSYCTLANDCPGMYCVHNKCRWEYTYCGDGYCDEDFGYGESCSNCSSDCGSCTKSDGSSCSYNSECSGGYCVHGKCRSSSVYCGDGYCDSAESCSSCSSDCSESCPAGIKKTNGEYCDVSDDCKSGNCQNYRCCVAGKTCCFSHFHCGLDDYCSSFYHFCEPAKPIGQKCADDNECLSNVCGNNVKICCEQEECCQNHSNCRSNEYCEQGTYYCRYKWREGDKCTGSAMCHSDYCDTVTWTCAEKPEGLDEELDQEPVQESQKEPKSLLSEAEVLLFVPESLSLKKGEQYTPLIYIENKGPGVISLGDSVLIDNLMPASLEVDQVSLRVFKRSLLPGEKASVEQDIIEKFSIRAKRQDQGDLLLRTVYFINDQVEWLEKKIAVTISREHIQREDKASSLFSEEMILEEQKGEYIFVEPDGSSDYQVTTNAWQEANDEVNKHLDILMDDFKGVMEPEIVGFFETIKSLEEAESAEEITETTIRALAPPVIIGAIDFVNLVEAMGKRHRQEQAFLNHFGESQFSTVPVKNEQGETVGYSKAVIKEEDGKKYAVKIGDL